jgi:hypothetical protein
MIDFPDCSLVGLGCSVLRTEIESLRAAGRVGIEMDYLDSMLHMDPVLLGKKMGRSLEGMKARGKHVLLVYGECHPFIREMASGNGVERVWGSNCIEILLGRSCYRDLLRQGAFFVLPEWARRWKEIIGSQLGLDERNARDFMGDLHTKIVYLDTGILDVPYPSLEAMSAYTGLDFEVRDTPLDLLAAALAGALAGASRPQVAVP